MKQLQIGIIGFQNGFQVWCYQYYDYNCLFCIVCLDCYDGVGVVCDFFGYCIYYVEEEYCGDYQQDVLFSVVDFGFDFYVDVKIGFCIIIC